MLAGLDANEPIELWLYDNHKLGFKQDYEEYYTLLIDGKFPDVASVIPSTSTMCAELDVDALIKAMKGNKDDKVLFIFEALNKGRGKLILRKGDTDTTFEVAYTGYALTIQFKVNTLLPLLNYPRQRRSLTNVTVRVRPSRKQSPFARPLSSSPTTPSRQSSCPLMAVPMWCCLSMRRSKMEPYTLCLKACFATKMAAKVGTWLTYGEYFDREYQLSQDYPASYLEAKRDYLFHELRRLELEVSQTRNGRDPYTLRLIAVERALAELDTVL